jgi:carbon catabolite-derepressing protein kinase
MDLQLYRVDAENYLVDFRNVGYYHTEPDQPGFARARRGSQQMDGGRPSALDVTSPDSTKTSPADEKEDSNKISEVCSPFLFLEAACRLIVELASG